ncbi:MAG: CaiB/BaiF CoA transferase family protein [Achromobacter veterisilvae]
MTRSMAPLKGIRILDFSKVLAGPMCTQALGDLGADVIKIEQPGAGDDTRAWPPTRAGGGAVFLAANRNKRSLALNLKTPEGLAAIHRLVASADVVVESFSPGVTERLGIDYATLKRHKPDLIYCSITGFGRVGPMADGKGYDIILQAFTGMQSITGEPDRPPVRAPFSPVDQGTGMHAYSSILAAIINRDRSGDGCQIDVSLFDTGISYLGYMFQAYWERGTEPQRFGCAHEALCPYQAFDASDKHVLIGIASETLWKRFCEVAGLQQALEDPRFRTNPDRVRNREATVRLVGEAVRKRSCREWVDLLTAEGIPCSQINGFAEVLAHPHTRASGLIAEYDSQAYGQMQAVMPPVRFNGLRIAPNAPPPTLGEHSISILEEAGLAPQEIERLLAKHVIGTGA